MDGDRRANVGPVVQGSGIWRVEDDTAIRDPSAQEPGPQCLAVRLDGQCVDAVLKTASPVDTQPQGIWRRKTLE